MKTQFALLSLLLCVLSAVHGDVRAQTRDARDERADVVGRAFVNMVNLTSDDDRMLVAPRVFPDSLLQGGAERVLGAVQFMHDEFAPMRYHHAELVRWEGPDGMRESLHVYALDIDNSQWKDFQFRVTKDDAFTIRQIAFVADVSEPIYLPNGGILNNFEWLRTYIDRLHAAEDLYGGVLLAVNGESRFEHVVGYADAARSKTLTPGTPFNLASGSKMFTAAAVARLVERGDLDWGDAVSAYVEGVDPRVTIHHLLTHTSGVSEYWTEENEPAMLRSRDPQHDFLELVLAGGQQFEPGAAQQYSNSNYVLAGAVLEAVTDSDWKDVLRRFVLAPAGMSDTTFPAGDLPDEAARPLTGERNDWRDASRGPGATAAGGALSTLGDMLRFSVALQDGTLISEESFRTVATSKSAGVPDARLDFGYGFILETMEDTRFVGHGGTADGVNFDFVVVPERDMTVVMYSNQNNGAFDDLKRNIRKLISGYR